MRIVLPFMASGLLPFLLRLWWLSVALYAVFIVSLCGTIARYAFDGITGAGWRLLPSLCLYPFGDRFAVLVADNLGYFFKISGGNFSDDPSGAVCVRLAVVVPSGAFSGIVDC